ncbi:hypothetical protein O181_046105 [Austropuccinia psidii MF-1]|uniref:Uncharacterized protein n=1 Tax=Austropuccinia psidii MF-1 TaxID=1389203 RepID=A0A9Q3DSP5_9BASI|nr:hypothetical protein [Austropuccinia psidii MF-1]
MPSTRSGASYNPLKNSQKGVTTTSLTLLLDGCGNPTWSQVGANWSRHIIYGQLAPLGALWHPRHNTFQWPSYGLRPYPAGPPGPLAIIFEFRATPFIIVVCSTRSAVPINPIGPNFGHGPPWINSSAMASGNHQRPSDQLSPSFPSTLGDFFPLSFVPSVLKVAGMDPIPPFQSRSQIPTPILKEDYPAHQSDKSWGQSEDSSRIPTTCICRSWVGTIHSGLLKGNSQEVLHYFNQLSRHQIFNTPWTTQFICTGLIQSTCMVLAQLGHFIFHCVNSITQFKFQDGQNCISQFGQYSH